MGAPSRASRVIKATAAELYAAFTEPQMLVQWMPPGEMTGEIHAFDLRVGGGYEMSLFYPASDTETRGKTTAREDRVHVRFVELSPPRRIVEAVRFESGDPDLAGEMTMTIGFEDAPRGTRVVMQFENLPPGLKPEDNDEGARMSLEQLARRFD